MDNSKLKPESGHATSISNAKNTTVRDDVAKISNQLEDLQILISNLNLDTREDWEKRRSIVQETVRCLALMHQVFENSNGDQCTDYGEPFEVFVHTFKISKHICEIVCKLCIHITLRFSSKNIQLCAGICDIPNTLYEVLQSFKTIITTVLFHDDFPYRTETIKRRNSFQKTCTDFNIFVCNEMKMALKVMKRSRFRPMEGFKPLLASVVKQFYYMGIGCGLLRVLLACDSRSNIEIENPSNPLARDFKEMLKLSACLLINGRYALRSLSIHGRAFIRCQDLDDNLRADLPLFDLFLSSRLLCGTKCTEQGYMCLSYAWNRDSKRCMLFYQRCSSYTQRDQTEKSWEHYEIRVLSDIAVGKPAQQSSTFPPYDAERAVDGERSTDFLQNSCSHTADSPEQNPWWRVDLRAVYYIASVRMLNRGMDRFGIDVSDRLQNVTVTVGLTESSVNTTCGFFAGPGTLSQLVVLDCPPETMGRYVMVSILTGPLTLCEVDVISF